MAHGTPPTLLLLLLAAAVSVTCYRDPYDYDVSKYCKDRSPYEGKLDLDQILGGWFGVEKILHTKGEYKIDYNSGECFFIDIREIDVVPTTPAPYTVSADRAYYNRALVAPPEDYRTRSFVLEWHEGSWKEEYHFKVNPKYRGFWPTNIPDRSVDNMYRFLGGVIQVLEVANNHLVLNFCMRLPYSKHFSVILSRSEHQLTAQDLAVIHNVFTAKDLSTSDVKRVCDNSAAANYSGALTVIVVLISGRWM